jgi:hypothetical protein
LTDISEGIMKTILTVALLLHAGLSLADHAQGQFEANDAAQACGWLLTEAECQRHRQVVADLNDPAALKAYLGEHMALLREREVMCGCAAERQVLARAHYR